MASIRTSFRSPAIIAVAVVALASGCNSLVGLNDLDVVDAAGTASAGADTAAGTGGGSDTTAGAAGSTDTHSGGSDAGDVGEGGEGGAPTPKDDCSTNQECTTRAMLDAMGDGGAPSADQFASVCVHHPAGHCVPLLSDDCHLITGDYLNDQAIIVGSLFSVTGPTAGANVPRQQAAQLGIEQINTAGGIPQGPTSANARPLVMVSCDETTQMLRAAGHLVNELKVPAIIGPNTSQDTLDISSKLTVSAGTLVVTPTGVASSIAALSDNDLTWLMVPNDVQRAPLMIDQINDLEKGLLSPTKKTVKLGIIFRNDALGIGTRSALDSLMINGGSLAAPINLDNNVQIAPYNVTDTSLQPIVDKFVTFAPDIIVLAGTAEGITKIMTPLEMAWQASTRPQYILIDSFKTADLLAAVSNNDGLRRRVRGTGITSGSPGVNTPASTFNDFSVDYSVRFGTSATTTGMGPSHDAAYVIGLGLAASHDLPVTGANIALGLRKLTGTTGTVLTATGSNARAAIQKLVQGEKISVIGTNTPFNWDSNGAVLGGTVEVWCIAGPSAKPTFASSTLTLDLQTNQQSGAYVQCE